MTAEQYVKDVTKRISCGRERRQDISRQLLAEIEERALQGDDLQMVLREMGEPQEVADSFNDNISPEERKQGKRKLAACITAISVVVILLLGGIIYWSFPKARELEEGGKFSRAKVESEAVKVIDLLDADDISALQQMATPRMAAVMEGGTLSDAKKQVCDGFGSRDAVGAVYVQQISQRGEAFAFCQVNVSYENTAVTYTITFDEDMKLAGLYMK